MSKNGIDLPATSVTGTWSGSLGGYWSTDGIIIDGTYIFPPPQPDTLTEDDDFYISDLIKTQTGLDDFSFNLKILDKAINQNNAYGAIKDIWEIVERERGWVAPHWRINDALFIQARTAQLQERIWEELPFGLRVTSSATRTALGNS